MDEEGGMLGASASAFSGASLTAVTAESILSEEVGASIAAGEKILLSSLSKSSLQWAEESRQTLRIRLHLSTAPLGNEGRLLSYLSPLLM